MWLEPTQQGQKAMSSMHDGSYYYGEGAVNAYAARESGRLQSEDGMKVPESEGMQSKKLLPTYPGEMPTQSAKLRWVRESRRCFKGDYAAVLRGDTPAKLEAETVEFDVTTLPALAADAGAAAVAARQALIAKYNAENLTKTNYKNSREVELRNEIAGHIGDSMEDTARIRWAALCAAHTVRAQVFNGKAMFDEIEAEVTATTTSLSNDKAKEMFDELQKTPLYDGSDAAARRGARVRRPDCGGWRGLRRVPKRYLRGLHRLRLARLALHVRPHHHVRPRVHLLRQLSPEVHRDELDRGGDHRGVAGRARAGVLSLAAVRVRCRHVGADGPSRGQLGSRRAVQAPQELQPLAACAASLL